MRRPALAALLLTTACSPAGAGTKTFPVGAPSARATGEQAQLERLTVEVRDGELQIGSKPGNWGSWGWGSRKALLVEVTVPAVRAATLTGSGSLSVDHVRTRSFAGTLTGSGSLSLPAIDAEQVSLTLTGSGDLNAGGRAGRSEIVARGSGDLNASGLTAQDTRVELTGSGDVAAGASRTADVSLAGSGDIRITGHPRCTIAKHGSGDVTCG